MLMISDERWGRSADPDASNPWVDLDKGIAAEVLPCTEGVEANTQSTDNAYDGQKTERSVMTVGPFDVLNA